MGGAVEQSVIDADCLLAALDPMLAPGDVARLAVGVEARGGAAAPEAGPAEALAHGAGAGDDRGVGGAGVLVLAGGATGAEDVFWTLVPRRIRATSGA